MANVSDTARGVTKGPRFRTSAAVMIVGILVAIPGVVVFGAGIWHTVFAPTLRVPGTTQLQLGSGTYIVFEHTGHTDNYGPVAIRRSSGVTIDARQLVVRAQNHRRIPVRNSIPNETIDRGSDHYVSAVEFTVPRAASYSLRFRTTVGKVMVARPLGDLFRRRVPWLVEIAAGWVLALIGVTMLIVGVVRRGRAKRAANTTFNSGGVAAADWFADPRGEHRLRYWDGRQWTDHIAD